MSRDPVNRSLIRLEVRRFASRCDIQEGSIQRADSLRELARLASVSPPVTISAEYEARDAARRVVMAAEDKAREIIQGQIDAFVRAEKDFRDGLWGKISDDWANLTGPLAHLRSWAKKKLAAAAPDLPLGS